MSHTDSVCEGKMEEPTTEPQKEGKIAQVKSFYSCTEQILYQALYFHRQYSVHDVFRVSWRILKCSLRDHKAATSHLLITRPALFLLLMAQNYVSSNLQSYLNK